MKCLGRVNFPKALFRIISTNRILEPGLSLRAKIFQFFQSWSRQVVLFQIIPILLPNQIFKPVRDRLSVLPEEFPDLDLEWPE